MFTVVAAIKTTTRASRVLEMLLKSLDSHGSRVSEQCH